MTEKLKMLRDINEPDPRMIRRVLNPDGTSALEAYPLDRHYKYISELKLISAVPESIRTHYDIGRNMLLYSWHVYSFYQGATLHTYSSIEYALRERFNNTDLNPRLGLKRLLEYAVTWGALKISSFENDKLFMHHYRAISMRNTLPHDYCMQLVHNIPKLRNRLAHGSYQLMPFDYGTISLCRSIINQLY